MKPFVVKQVEKDYAVVRELLENEVNLVSGGGTVDTWTISHPSGEWKYDRQDNTNDDGID